MPNNESFGTCLWCKKPVLETDGATLHGDKVWHSYPCYACWEDDKRARKLETTGFLNITRKEARAVKNQTLINLRNYIVENIGQPCKYYDPGCTVCRAWEAWLMFWELMEK